MRICLLTNQDLDSDTIAVDDWPADPRPFLPEASWDLLVLEKETAVRDVILAGRRDYDLFFNLCDGAWDEDTPGIEVVLTLERMGVPFTGAASSFYEPSRDAMKRVCRAWGIDTPAHVFAASEDDVDRALAELSFPMFVKHPSSYASIGLTRQSRVETPGALAEQAARMIHRFGRALIEEFIEGTECTVLVAENPDDGDRPIAYQPIQYRFPDGECFKHSDMKWVEYARMGSIPVRDPGLDCRLREASALFFRGLGGSGYGRCDIRIDADGRPFMLEINANCGIYFRPEDAGSADLCLLNDPAGHEGFTRTVVRAALERHLRLARKCRVRPVDGAYALYATGPIAAGERILDFESSPHTLVSRTHVERHWPEEEKDWFFRYAWPITDDLWVTWSRDPDEWMPINHSCDPAAWLDGLDVVARRAIIAGEEITLDYATFYNERMPSFECRCRSRACRGTISGDDYLKPFVSRYGEHLSDYVLRRRRKAGLA